MSERQDLPRRSPNQFPTTRLSLVLAAADTPGTESRDALDALCRLYWYPLYVFIRRQGHGVEEARDLTQAGCPPSRWMRPCGPRKADTAWNSGTT
jgi:RNA polymerase sigma-70 factor (ECF subfamily)